MIKPPLPRPIDLHWNSKLYPGMRIDFAKSGSNHVSGTAIMSTVKRVGISSKLDSLAEILRQWTGIKEVGLYFSDL